MKKINFSVIVPVKNEEKSINEFIDSLISQTIKPDEIVITDGGSTDKTKEIIKSYIKKGYPIKLIESENALPGKGRNLSIENAKYNLIAMTDAGIILDKYWLENLSKPFLDNKDLDVCYGCAIPITETLFEKCAAITYVPYSKIDNSIVVIPTVASLMLKKDVWERAGKFPEDLRTGEDMIFLKNIDSLKVKSYYEPSAVVYWKLRNRFPDTFKLSFIYGRDGAKTKIALKDVSIRFAFYLFFLTSLFISLKFNIFLIVPVLIFFLIRVYKKMQKNPELAKKILKSIAGPILLILVIFVVDLGSMIGFIYGLFRRIKK